MFRVRSGMAAALAAVCCAGFVLSGCDGGGGDAPDSSSSAPPHTSASSSTQSVEPAARRKPTQAQLRTRARNRAHAQVGAIMATRPKGSVSVAALDTSNGARFDAGATHGMWTASTYKLLMLVALMLRNGGTGGYGDSATRAIENSDNSAGYQLYLAAGGTPGVQSALNRLGMRHTVPGSSDPTFTRTSASDYLRLLGALVHDGPLNRGQRGYALHLMRSVESDQRWGVGVVADKGTTFANKNGWLSIENNGPEESDDGLWAVNSVGVVRVHGHQMLMAVFTRHNSGYGSGVRLVQRLARTIAPAVA